MNHFNKIICEKSFKIESLSKVFRLKSFSMPSIKKFPKKSNFWDVNKYKKHDKF